jgi:hypothetical protein
MIFPVGKMAAFIIYDRFSCNSEGLLLKYFLKTLEKYDGSVNPTA